MKRDSRQGFWKNLENFCRNKLYQKSTYITQNLRKIPQNSILANNLSKCNKKVQKSLKFDKIVCKYPKIRLKNTQIPQNNILATIFGLRQGYKDKSCPGQENKETRTLSSDIVSGCIMMREWEIQSRCPRDFPMVNFSLSLFKERFPCF